MISRIKKFFKNLFYDFLLTKKKKMYRCTSEGLRLMEYLRDKINGEEYVIQEFEDTISEIMQDTNLSRYETMAITLALMEDLKGNDYGKKER